MSEESLTVKDFNPDDRPQEKAIRFGVATLSVSELWAVILRNGQPGCPITTLTRNLMDANDNRLKKLERRTREELTQTRGIGEVKAVQIECVLELVRRYNREEVGEHFIVKSSKDIYTYIAPHIAHLNHEEIWVIFLNRRNEITGDRKFTSGSSTASVFDAKAIIREALLRGAEGLAMCHNHPSGNLTPSIADDKITRALHAACDTMGLRMLDHLIVTQYGSYSYADQGRL